MLCDEMCATPRNRTGKCVPIRKCPQLWGMYTSSNRSEIEFEYLRQSACAKRNIVCCETSQEFAPFTIRKSMNLYKNDSPLRRKLTSMPSRPQICGQTNTISRRIYGGSAAELTDSPWMAMISGVPMPGALKNLVLYI